MNPNAGEPGDSGTAIADKPINPVSGVVPEPSVIVPSSNAGPDTHALSDLEKLVNAAKEQVPDPQSAFMQQFGPKEPPTAEVPSVDQQVVASDIPQTVAEIVPQPEQTPAEKLKQQISGSVDAFLAEVTKEKVTA